MEIFGGFMVMMSIISLFLAVVWLIMPFVVFAIKGKQDRTLEVLEAMEKRLAVLETRLQPEEPFRNKAGHGNCCDSAGTSAEAVPEQPLDKNDVTLTGSAADKKDPEISPAV